MSKSFAKTNWTDIKEPEIIQKDKDIEDNRKHTLKVIELTKNKLPYGMSIKALENHCEIVILRSIMADDKPRIECIPYDQSKATFDIKCDDICEKAYRIAKQAGTKKKARVKECESKAIDGKCSCGFRLHGRQFLNEAISSAAKYHPRPLKGPGFIDKSYNDKRHQEENELKECGKEEELGQSDDDCPF